MAYKVAIITGGASGMGLAVGLALLGSSTKWHVHGIDRNDPHEDDIVAGIEDIVLHKADVTDWPELSGTFDKIYNKEKRLDFVFANAGVPEMPELLEKHDDADVPPPLGLKVIDVNLTSVITTSYLAAHYLRRSRRDNSTQDDAVIVCTSSCAGLYGDANFAGYTAAKHGVVGFVRSIAPSYLKDGVRINCLCPGSVDTRILGTGAKLSSLLRPEVFTPIGNIVDAVRLLIDNKGATDANGYKVEDGRVNRVVVEVNIDKFYFRRQVDYCDSMMRDMMGGLLANIEL